MKVTIEYTNGSTTSAQSVTDAENHLRLQYPDLITGDRESAGEGRERILVWEDEASSINDDGAHVVAQIIISAE